MMLIAPFSSALPEGRTGDDVFLPGADIGVSGFYGKTFLRGFYDDYLADGTSFGIGLTYPLPFLRRMILAETELFMSENDFRGSGESRLTWYTLRAGAALYHPLTKYFQPFGGLYFQESRLVFDADTIGERATAYKPGLAFKAGFFSVVYSSFGIRAGVEYSLMEVSDEWLETYAVTAAAIMRFQISRGPSLSGGYGDDGAAGAAKNRAESVYLRGMADLDRGETDRAEASFREVLSLKADHPGAAKKIDEIRAARESYAEAKSLTLQKKYFEAIPHLEKSRAYLKDAERDLSNTRSMLAGEVPELERRGIRAYESRDYDQCIIIMRKILAADPENQTGMLYLPRAQSRKQAIDRLK